MTAEEFIIKSQDEFRENDKGGVVHQLMIEFAKHHVKAALKEALESIPCLGSSSDIATYEEIEEAVLNSYPLTNIT